MRGMRGTRGMNKSVQSKDSFVKDIIQKSSKHH